MAGVVRLDGKSLDIATVDRVARDPRVRVELDEVARSRCEASRTTVERVLERGEPIYGINTGFGDLARVAIARQDLESLQKNLILSHAVGVGQPLGDEVVRAVMLLRANTLAMGTSGVRPALIDMILGVLNAGIIPQIPEIGSLGASGDLAPLAHLALVFLGLGEARLGDETLTGAEALGRVGLQPIVLAPKEGLSLINGTQVTTGLACLCLAEALLLQKAGAITAAMSTEALLGTDASFHPELHKVRPHPGQKEIAAFMRSMMAESQLRLSHLHCDKVQDSYSIRCIPQVHGAALDSWEHARKVISIEVNSATDNPLVLGDEILSGGNFHAEPVGLVLDLLTLAMAEIGNISERRTFRLLTESLSGLPPFLTPRGGVNSGLMITQYTAAALVTENKVLSHPASVDSIPTSADQEDHVSMATTAARKCFRVMEHISHILAIELLAAGQALEFRSEHRPGRGTEAARRLLRREVAPLEGDRLMTEDMRKARDLILSGELEDAVEEATCFSWEVLSLRGHRPE